MIDHFNLTRFHHGADDSARRFSRDCREIGQIFVGQFDINDDAAPVGCSQISG